MKTLREPLTDEEVIWAWMEPNHQTVEIDDLQWHGVRYRDGNLEYCGRLLTLDALWEVEDRLPLSLWEPYIQGLFIWKDLLPKVYVEQYRALIHATAGQKIKALAAVLRQPPQESE